MAKQSEYILERFDDKKQISRFGSDGNRIVVIKVEAFDVDEELEFVLACLNKQTRRGIKYESKEFNNEVIEEVAING